MKDDIDLNSENWEEQLQAALAELPSERAPRRLRRALQSIPGQERKRGRRLWWWFNPAWAFALLLVPLAALVYLQNERLQQQEQEVAQARQDLILALKYIEKVNQSAGLQITAAIDSGITRPVTDETLKVIQQPLKITREYEL